MKSKNDFASLSPMFWPHLESEDFLANQMEK